jgi:pimeloyl-ACP methyl ester carboxylesterase
MLAVAACSGENVSAPRTDAAIPSPPTASTGLVWQAVGEGTETTTLAVPLDHDAPDGPTIELFLARHHATDPERRIGTLLVNPGGPGTPGSELALRAALGVPAELLARFDIVGWDPRGTGRSTPAIDCVDDLDARYRDLDTSPDDEGEWARLRDAADAFAASCIERTGDLLAHVGTNDSARDMDAIRRALGEETISYLGFSYGSELGATWATMFPDTVRAAVLDGAADPTAAPDERLVQRAAGFEAALGRYLAAAGPDAGARYDALMARLDVEPLPSEAGRPALTRAIATQAVAQAMYSSGFWPQLTDALAAAEAGDGSGLLRLWDAYLLRQPDGTWSDAFEAGQVISCMDHTMRLDADAARAADERVAAAAPRMAPGLLDAGTCASFPTPDVPRVPITGAEAGPIVVIGTTGDPATPLDSSRAMASTLEDGRLVVVTADQHTGYGTNACVDEVVHRYLIDLEVPAADTAC